MHKLILSIVLSGAAGLLVAVAPAHAQGVSPGLHGFQVGGAALYSDVSGAADESGVGTYFHAAVDLWSVPAIARFGVEGGHLRTRRIATPGGDTRISNRSVSATATLVTLPLLDLHARIGYEDGDTSGMFQAVGATLTVLPALGVRAEFTNNNGFDAVSLGLRLRLR